MLNGRTRTASRVSSGKTRSRWPIGYASSSDCGWWGCRGTRATFNTSAGRAPPTRPWCAPPPWNRRRAAAPRPQPWLPTPSLGQCVHVGQADGTVRCGAGIAHRADQIHASGFVPTEMAWPSTWTDRRDRDRTPSIPGHELAGVVAALGYGTTGVSVGQRVFGLADWHRDGTLAEYVAIEARNLRRCRATSTSRWARACRSRA